MKYKNLAISYGKMSHWWGPGIFNSIVLSSNAPSQESFLFGTQENFKINKISFGANLLIMPYENHVNTQIYFSGLKLK